MEEKSDGRRRGVIIGILAIVLGLAGGGWYYWAQDDNTTKDVLVGPQTPVTVPQPPAKGRSIEIGPPPAPVLLGPGTESESGEVIYTTTPAMRWQAVQGAIAYGLNISVEPYGAALLVYENEAIFGDSTSFVVPPGILTHGKKYRWNMRVQTTAGWGPLSSRLYFQVAGGSETTSSPETPRVDHGPRIREILQYAEREFERGQYRSALSYSDEALRLNPNHREAQALRKRISDTLQILESPSRPPAGEGVFGAETDLSGVWVGTGQQYDGSSWPIRMRIDSNWKSVATGEVVGTIEYPTLQCGGEIVKTQRALLERLTYGRNRCVDGGTIVLGFGDERNYVRWNWYYPDGRVGATAKLVRE